jgi:hypothetical protein
VPVSIGFLGLVAAASRSGADAQVDVRPAVKRLDDDAHIRSTAESAVPICLDRHNSATDRSSFRRKRNDMDHRGRNRRKTAERSHGQLPAKELGKSWRFFETYPDL